MRGMRMRACSMLCSIGCDAVHDYVLGCYKRRASDMLSLNAGLRLTKRRRQCPVQCLCNANHPNGENGEEIAKLQTSGCALIYYKNQVKWRSGTLYFQNFPAARPTMVGVSDT